MSLQMVLFCTVITTIVCILDQVFVWYMKKKKNLFRDKVSLYASRVLIILAVISWICFGVKWFQVMY